MYDLLVRLLEPYTLFLLALGAALACAFRRAQPRTRALRIAAALFGLLALLSTPWAGYLALGTLEWSYPESAEVPAQDDTLVVLGGGLIVDDEQGTRARLSDSSLQRCAAALKLYRGAGGGRVIVSGGRAGRSTLGPPLAAVMRDFLVLAGVRPEDVVVEQQSTTTYENAVSSAALLARHPAPGKVRLVTEAAHMRRAAGCFRELGVDVIPAPCDHHASRLEWDTRAFIPAAAGISQVGHAAHEWLGLAWYRLRGRI